MLSTSYFQLIVHIEQHLTEGLADMIMELNGYLMAFISKCLSKNDF